MRALLFFIFTLLSVAPLRAQNTLTVATYNTENLFDTINDPGIRDGILTPEAYRIKLSNLARVIGELAPDMLALCEVENAGVLNDLLATPPLEGLPFRFVHYDSPDPRGIDVAIIYRTDRVELLNSEPIAAPERYPTRDMLRAEFRTRPDGQKLAVYAVHLPSRRGGSGSAARMRELLAVRLADCVDKEKPGMSVVVMGDLNDNPDSRLVKRRLGNLRCATAGAFRNGVGSYAWRDTWLMYDNILLGGGLKATGDARVFVRPWMLTPEGRFRGYPYREVVSDHLPVFINLAF